MHFIKHFPFTLTISAAKNKTLFVSFIHTSYSIIFPMPPTSVTTTGLSKGHGSFSRSFEVIQSYTGASSAAATFTAAAAGPAPHQTSNVGCRVSPDLFLSRV